MPDSSLAAPQLVVNSRMIYSSWIPEDPQAAAALLPRTLAPAANRAVFMNPDGATPARFFTHYFNSSELMRNYVAERGVPAAPGSTTLKITGAASPPPT